MIRVWRIVRRKFAATAFSGIGAEMLGGRWNPRGVRVIYTSSSAALAAWELFVHVDPTIRARNLVLIPAEIPANVAIEEIEVDALPRRWRHYPPPKKLQTIGAQWIARRTSAVLRVPSAVVISDSNLLINPEHEDFSKIQILAPIPFQFDPRVSPHRPMN